MTKNFRLRFGVFFSAFLIVGLALSFDSARALAEKANIKVSDLNTDEDTSIVIKKGPTAVLSEKPEFEVVSGEQDIEGDPAASSGEARTSWKAACADWKKEVKELNRENSILAISCNSPSATLLDSGQRQMRSTGDYKLKVRIRSAPLPRK